MARLTRRNTEQPPDHVEVLLTRQQLIDSGVLTGQTDQTTHLGRLGEDIESTYGRLAGVGTQQCREDSNRRGLSSAVRSEQTKDDALAYGQVDSVAVISDQYTGRSKGFGFVEMSNETEAKAAMEGLNGNDMDGRTLKVNEARPRNEGQRSGNRGDYRRNF